MIRKSIVSKIIPHDKYIDFGNQNGLLILRWTFASVGERQQAFYKLLGQA